MRGFTQDYHQKFLTLFDSIRITDKRNRLLDFYQGIEAVVTLVKKSAKIGGKVFFIGNGGSAAIASHMAIDFWKNGSITALAFNDGALITCLSNDLGYENVFKKPIEFFAQRKDVLFAISSSGESKNILEAVKAAKSRGLQVVTLSGFAKKNPLSRLGNYNFYVPCYGYGPVEVIHQYICHFILDTIMKIKLNLWRGDYVQ